MPKRNESTADLVHIVVTVTPAFTMKITLNGFNQFVVKLTDEQKTTIRGASTRRKSNTRATLG